MNIGDPSYLKALWLLLPLAALCIVLYRRRVRQMRTFFAADALAKLATGWRAKRRARRLALWLFAIALLLFSLARPQWGFRWEESTSRGLDILVLLDTSRSMLAQDFKPNRLQQAKWGLRDFTRELRGDRVGLIPFAGAAYLQCPLTIDYAAFLMSLADVRVGMIPRGGTALATALKTAIETFDKQAESDRVLLLITDGEDHEGRIENWLPKLKEKNIRVYAIGVGSAEGEPLPAADGGAGFQKDADGKVVLSSLHEDPLRKLAMETGGAFIRAAPGDLGLDALIKQHLSSLTRKETDSRLAKIWEERAGWFIGLALCALALESAVRERRGGAQ
ncbi:MAG: VWA domain-containing protein [Kiritimatiellae bacterium]|nr:VWA domain-containing protein [Kiritimatiellia bacterium]